MRRSGYVLVPVVLGLSLIAITAFLLAGESALSTDATGRLLGPEAAEHLARSALARARWQARQGDCSGGISIPTTALADGTYDATSTGGGTSTSYVLSADQDAWIRSDDVDRNNGSSAWNHVRSETGKYEQVLTRFDLSSLPVGGAVSSAIAWFHIKSGKPHPEGDVWFHEILADWTELGVTWEAFDEAYSSVRLATVPAQDAGNVWVGVNLAAQVQAWLNGRPNHGILMRSEAEGIHAEYTGRAEGTNPPRLEVTIANGDPSPLDVLATGTLPDGLTRQVSQVDLRADQAIQLQTLRPGASEGGDTYLWEFYKNNNFGTDDETWVATGNNNEAHAVFHFGMTAIPAGARIVEATLSLHHRNGNDPDVPISVHRITIPWLEDEATWNERENGTVWGTSGGDFDPTPVSTTLVGPASNVRYEWDVTSLVQGWIDGEYPDYGLLLKTDAPGIFGERFETSDHADPTRRPSLTVRYACECGAPCMPPAGSGEILMVVRNDDLIDYDAQIKRIFEDWGYTVSVVNDDWSQNAIETAAAAADVVFVSESASSASVGNKLNAISTGIVSAEGDLNDELGLGGGLTTVVTDTVQITANDHYITSVFRLESLPFKTVASEMHGVSGATAPEGSVLATAAGAPAVVTVDAGAALAGGGASPGRRVLVPVGKRDVGWEFLTNEGALLVQRALAWAQGAANAPGPSLLLVVVNDGSLTVQEEAKRTLIESWGFEVTLLDEDDNQSAFDTALVDAAVVFVTEDATASDVGNKLTAATVGVVTEEVNLANDLGMAGEPEWGSGTQVTIDVDDHYITEPFSAGSLTVLTASESLASFEDYSPDLIRLGNVSGRRALVALEDGAALYGGGTAAGRRVLLPWGGNNMDVASLNDDGLTLFRRALEWGAGASLPPVVPLAHWKLDETSGLTAADDVGTHDGTLTGGPAWTMGQVDGGLDFDGANDYVAVPHDAGLDLTTFSISAWIQPDALSGWQIVVNKGTTTSAVNYYLATNGDEIGLGYYNGGWIEFNTTSANLSTGQWYHVVATYDDATRQGTIHLDGSQVHQSTVGVSPLPNGDDLTLGRSAFGEYWPGVLDDVRLYDTVLGSSRVLELYEEGGGAGGGGGSPPSGPCNGTYRDEFDAETFSGSNGTLDWSATPWQEVGESDGPTGGDVRIDNDVSDFQLRIRDNQNGGEGVERLIDLDGATSATISLQYRRQDLDNGNDYVALLVSMGGLAGPWTEIDRFGTNNDSSYQSYSRDISSFISANTAIRLRSSPNMGNSDTVWFDDIEVSCSP